MSASVLQVAAAGGQAPGTGSTVTFAALTAGSFHVIAVAQSKGSTGAPTIAIANYTLLNGASLNNGSLSGGIWYFGRWITAASGAGSTTAALTTTSITWSAVQVEIAGLDPNAGVLVAGTPTLTTTSGTQTLTSNTRVTTEDEEYLLTIVGGRASTSTTLNSAGGGATLLFNTSSGRAAQIFLEDQTVVGAGTSVTHTASITNVQGNLVNGIATLALRVLTPETFGFAA
jgi:hypothetical protein